ncbi:MAG: type IX secretion system plug protein domain-containing protein [Balneolales bacterium]
MKAPSKFSYFIFLGILALSFSCTRSALEDPDQQDALNVYPDFQNSVAVQGQKQPPEDIHSIQLYRNTLENAPIIELNTDQQLTLKFDELGFDVRSFRIKFTHHNADWSPSTLLPGFYQQGFMEDVITDSQTSQARRPAYTHYTYTFPNESVDLISSGNYLIEVYDDERGEILFSLPFFIQENAGQLITEIDELYGLDQQNFLFHQVFATYSYPNEVMIPEVDLKTHFVQNQFWGRARQADVVETARPGQIRSHNLRENSFAGRYEFRKLDLDRLETEAFNILEVRPETTPPMVILMRDVVNLDISPPISESHRSGSIADNVSARYADVHFELEIPRREQTNLPIYLIGPFNNWGINKNHRMTYNSETGSYTGNAIIKEGIYDYTYAVVEDNLVDALRLDASFASSQQIYHSFIYFSDPQTQSDRLLKVHEHRTR